MSQQTTWPNVTPRAPALERRVATVSVIVPAIGALGAIGFAAHFGLHGHAVAVAAVMYLLTMLGITVGFHRLATHRSFQTVRPVRELLLVLGSMAAQGPPLFWVAAHRRHHQSSDEVGDPHSPHAPRPKLRGFIHAHVGWMLDYSGDDLARYARDLLSDRRLLALNQHYPLWVLLGLALPGLIGGLIEGTTLAVAEGVLLGGSVRIFAVHHATWAVNSVCHTWGSRSYRTGDQSRNSLLVAVLTLGEGWHNNHHAFPTSARHGLEWWQLDPSYAVIKVLGVFGLASGIRVPSQRDISRSTLPAREKEL